MIVKNLMLIAILLNASCSTFSQDNKKEKIRELLTLTHQDSLVIKKFEKISSLSSENSSDVFSDSSTLSILSTYVKDTSLLNNMKTIMKDTVYTSLIQSFKNINATKTTLNQEEIKKMATKFINEEIVDIYDHQFSFEEISDMIKFYKTNIGQKTLYLMPGIQNEVDTKIEAKYIAYVQDQLK